MVHPHLAGDVLQDLVSVVELYPEHRDGQRLDDRPFDLDGPVFLGHVLASGWWVLSRIVSKRLGIEHRFAHLPSEGRGRNERNVSRPASVRH